PFALVLGAEFGLHRGLVLEGLCLGPPIRPPLALGEQPHRRPSVMLVRCGDTTRKPHRPPVSHGSPTPYRVPCPTGETRHPDHRTVVSFRASARGRTGLDSPDCRG